MPRDLSGISYLDFSAKIHQNSLKKDKVIKAQLEVTYRCNLHCLHCYTDPYNKPEHFSKELTYQEICRILDEMADYGILWLNFTGGEVFARKDFLDIYDYACSKGFITTIFTNGTVFTDNILSRLQKQPPFFIDISCHSVNEEAFDRFTQVKGSFARFMEGIKLLKTSGLAFRMKTKAMNWNADEIPSIRQYVESLGLNFGFTTSLAPRLDGDLSSLDLRLSPGEIVELETKEAVWKDGDESCIENESELPQNVPDQLYRCTCATSAIHVSAWGELGTCTHEYEVRVSLKTHSLSEAIQQVFGRVRALKYQTVSACRSCGIYSFCDKSPTQLRLEKGSPESSSPYHCDVAWNQAKRFLGNHVEHPLKTDSEERKDHESKETLRTA